MSWPEARLFFPIEPPDLKDWFAHYQPKPLDQKSLAILSEFKCEILAGVWGENLQAAAREVETLERMLAAKEGR